MQKENENICPICSGEKLRTIGPTQGGFYIRCLVCGSETRKSSSDRNLQKDFEASQKTCYSDMDLLETPTFSSIQHLVAKERMKLVNKFLGTGRLLEIGPGGGEFMCLARDSGMDVVGVEHSPVATRRLSEELGLSVKCGLFEDFNFEEKFDAIVNMHVIEHVVDPAFHLSMARSALKKNGLLFLGTPNLNSWSRAIAGRKWQGYTPAHQHLFTIDSMKKLLMPGWEIINFTTIETWENWPWTILSMIRNVDGERPLDQAGKVSQRLSPWLLNTIGYFVRPTSWPFRKIQNAMRGGFELIVIAKPR
jgi:2-polyprenyl-3-methyl-5-hydroxy-6-metoxy-1,4-benzoquinol methylase